MSKNTPARITGPVAKSAAEPDETAMNLKRVIIAGFVVIGLFFGGLGGWAATAELNGAVIAPGEIIVENYRKQVQHLTGGIVSEILVREGDPVEKGQVLIRLNGERALASQAIFRARMDTLQAQQARLNAVIDDAEQIRWPKPLLARAQDPANVEVAETIASEARIFQANLEARKSQEALYRAQIKQQEELIQGLERQEGSILEVLESYEEEVGSKRKLLEDGHIQRTHIMQLERQVGTQRARLDQIRTSLQQAKESIATLELQIADLFKRYAQEAASQLGQVRQSISDLREQLRPAEDEVRRLEIRAPESGVVVNLNVRTEGGVINGGQPLMEIVPHQGRLIVSVEVPTAKIDSVHAGQLAKIQLSAFSSRNTPKVLGYVTYVSADSVESQGGREEPHYLVYVDLDPDSVREAINDPARLTPGMPAEVFIQTEARTMLSYLMSPITDSLGRAFRE